MNLWNGKMIDILKLTILKLTILFKTKPSYSCIIDEHEYSMFLLELNDVNKRYVSIVERGDQKKYRTYSKKILDDAIIKTELYEE